MFDEYPSPDDFKNIYCDQMQFDKLDPFIDFFKNAKQYGDIRDLTTLRERLVIEDFVRTYHNHYRKTLMSYSFSKYYYDKGIPDSFADCTSLDHRRRIGFEYHADLFFFKLFSTLEMIAHILNRRFRIDFASEKVSFKKVTDKVLKLKATSSDAGLLYIADILDTITRSKAFTSADKYRNALTHRNPPLHDTIWVKGDTIAVSAPNSTTCSQVFSIMNDSLDLLHELLLSLKQLASISGNWYIEETTP
ncbi:hypothetical protein JJB07_03335 [Tumebacillus sp. ITR2]|uniref:Cthe-2314-like HEPN domain-containing protein n=1 Tax=Tumebacillus amylolyticus TaxID=2801339 RepID=A0ABS1J5X7_9BACL|nr:Cthe_2314 family HEPN domain-containing protein [Tumebacillus amylolyticus]MBL0385674.1 hypothetical protein [Tumebacillus amylolyticus]